MKNLIFLFMMLAVSCFAFGQGSNACVSCNNNTIDTANYSSAVGSENVSTGLNSFAGGYQSEATKNYSFVFGDSSIVNGLSSISLGYHNKVDDWYSVVLGRNNHALYGGTFIFGMGNKAMTESSYLFGEFLKTTAGGSVTIGIGAGIGNKYLNNNVAYSLMVGFNSDIPTFFVGESSGIGTTGQIGIGNMKDPQTKLHIYGDDDLVNHEDASLFIESANNNYFSTFWIGDKMHSIKTRPNANLFFDSGENDFVFQNGNIGINTDEPTAKLQVKDGDIFIEDIDRGIIMKSPDGNCWRGTLDNSGSLQFVQVNCDDLTTGEKLNSNTKNSKTNIYPNPAGDKVFVSINPELTGATLEISDLSGKTVHSEKLNNAESFIDLSDYQPGMYLFRIVDGNGKVIEKVKVVKQ